MQKLFGADVDYTALVVAANEEFPSAPALPEPTAKNTEIEVRGWNAYEIWRKRIRRQPGMRSLFLPQA